jgi:cytochrome P450
MCAEMDQPAGNSRLVDLIRRGESPEFQLLRPKAGADPYAIYRALAATGRVVRSNLGYWLVTGHQECAALLGDERMGALSGFANRPDVVRGTYPTLERLHDSWFLFADPPRHDLVRRRVAESTARAIRTTIANNLDPLASEMVRAIDWSRPVDIVTRLAQPYPTAVIGDILGVPGRDLGRLRTLTVVMSESMEPFLGTARLDRAERAARELCQYFEELGSTRRRGRAGCLEALVDGADMEAGVGLAHAVLLLTAGQETTVNLVSMGVLALLTQRPELPGPLSGRESVGRAVDELLRFTSPIQLVVRRVLDRVVVDGASFERGDLVWLLIAAANRDPEVFAEPDCLDLGRHHNDHLAFAGGTHVCFGAALTRAEMSAVMRHLTPVLPALEADQDSVLWQRKRTGRGLDRLVVRPRASSS